MSFASLTFSNLSGVNLAGVILDITNFWGADLSGIDFTVTDVVDGITFASANLSNSNFEGVDLSPKDMYSKIFENKAHLKNLDSNLIVEDLFGGGGSWNVFIISTEVHGNDLAVNYILFNNFTNTNLENANFKNTVLHNVSFYEANLTNANLSGADLAGANLSGADLTGASLSGAVYYGNTILNCVGHPICNN